MCIRDSTMKPYAVPLMCLFCLETDCRQTYIDRGHIVILMRERERGQTDRQTDRQRVTERQRDRGIERDRDRQIHRHTDRETETDRDRDRQTETQGRRQTDRDREREIPSHRSILIVISFALHQSPP